MSRSTAPASWVLAIAGLAASTAAPLAAQWTPQSTGTTAEFRGLYAVDSNVVWAAGRGGVVARTTDGGRTWRADSIPGASHLFLIDVHARDAARAWVLGTDFDGGLGQIYATSDSGRSWVIQYERADSGMFFDGMAFSDATHGIAFGDPIRNQMVVVRTEDGEHWNEIPAAALPAPRVGEASFAASGTDVSALPGGYFWIGTGGSDTARILRSTDGGRTWSAASTQLGGSPSTGIFGVAFRDRQHGVAVGGNYQTPRTAVRNVLASDDGGRTWKIVAGSIPAGVRYAVVYVPGTRTVVAVGPSGSGYSTDDGVTWTGVDDQQWNTVAFVSPTAGWVAGPGGRIARWSGSFERRE